MASVSCGEAGDSVMCEAGDGACGDERRGREEGEVWRWREERGRAGDRQGREERSD